MNRRVPLERRTPLQRGGALVRRTAFKAKASAGMKRTGTTKSRKASASTIIPKLVRDAVDARDQRYGQPQCQRCGLMITGWFSRHHRNPRGMGGSKADPHTMANLVLLCGSATSSGGCHAEVESHRVQAELDGWLVPMNIRPEQWPVKRFGRDEYQQPGEDWIVVPPNPMQLAVAS